MIKSTLKFIFWTIFILCVIGVITVIACVKEAKTYYDTYISPSYEGSSLIDTTTTHNNSFIYPSPPPPLPRVHPKLLSTTNTKNNIINTISEPLNNNSRTNYIAWNYLNTHSISIINNKSKCIFLYFKENNCCSHFETQILTDEQIILSIDKFYAIKIENMPNVYSKFNIHKIPSVIILSNTIGGYKLSGDISQQQLNSVLNKPDFNSCL